MYRFILAFILMSSIPFAFSADDNSKKEGGAQGEEFTATVSPVKTEEDKEQIRNARPEHITFEHVAGLIMLMDPKAHQLLELPAIRKLLEDQDVRESIVANRGNTSGITWDLIREDAGIIQRMDPSLGPKKKPNLLDELGYRQNNAVKRMGYNLWSHQIAGFPLEAFVFYAAIGASMYRQYYTDSLQGGRRDPRWFENFMYELTSPVGVFSFFCFVLASGITNNLYTQFYASKKVPAAIKVFSSSRERRIWRGSRFYALNGRISKAVIPSQHFVNQYKYRFIGAFGGQLGMAMGMMASNVIHEAWNLYAHDPNFKNCRDKVMQEKHKEDNEHFCDLAYDQSVETILSWLPGLGSLISASILSHWLVASVGKGVKFVISKTIPRMAVTIPMRLLLNARLLIPGFGKVMAAGQWAGTLIFKVFAPRFINLYAFMEMDQLFTHPLWEWIAGERLKANRVSSGISNFVDSHTNYIKYDTPWKRCKGEGEEEDCEYHPSVRAIHQTANRFMNWRQHKSAAMYMAYQTWSVYVSTALGSFDVTKNMYRSFFESKIQAANELNTVSYFGGVEEEKAYWTLNEILETINGYISSTGISEPESLNLDIVSSSHSRFLKPINEIRVKEKDRLFVLRKMFEVADVKSSYGEGWNSILRTTKNSLKANFLSKKIVDACFEDLHQTITNIREGEVVNDQDRFALFGAGINHLLNENIKPCVENSFKQQKNLPEAQFIAENFNGFLDPSGQSIEYTASETGFLEWYFNKLYFSISDMTVVFLKDKENSLSASQLHEWVDGELLALININQRNLQTAMNLTEDQWEQAAYAVLQEKTTNSHVNIEQIKPFYGEGWDESVKTTTNFLKSNSKFQELVNECFEDHFYKTIQIIKEQEFENDQERFAGVNQALFGLLKNDVIEKCRDKAEQEGFLEIRFVVENFNGFLGLDNETLEYAEEEGKFLYWFFDQLRVSILNMGLTFLRDKNESLRAGQLHEWIDGKLLFFLRENQRRIQNAMSLTDYQWKQIAYIQLRKKVLAAGVEYLNDIVKWNIWFAQKEFHARRTFVEEEDDDDKDEDNTDSELQRAYRFLGADNIYTQLYQHSHQIKPKAQGMATVEEFNGIYNTKEKHTEIDYHPSRLKSLRTPDMMDFIIAAALCGPDSNAEEYQEMIKKVSSKEPVEDIFPDQNMDNILGQMPVFDRTFVGASYSFYPPRIVDIDESARQSICRGAYSMMGEKGKDPEDLYGNSTMDVFVKDLYNGYFPSQITKRSYLWGFIKSLDVDEDKVYSNLLHLVLDHIKAPSSMEEFDKWWEQNVQPQIDIFVKAAEREYNIVMNDRLMIPFFANKVKDIEITSTSPSPSNECEDPSTVSRWDLTFQELPFFKSWTVKSPQGYYRQELYANSVDYMDTDCVKKTDYSTGLPRGLFQNIYLELHYWADMILHFAEIRKKEHPDEETRNRVSIENVRTHLESLIGRFNLDDCLNAGPTERDKSLFDDTLDHFLWGESITKQKVLVCKGWVEKFMKSENQKDIQEDIANIMNGLSISQRKLQAIKVPDFIGSAKTKEEEQELLRKSSTAFKYNIDATEYEVKINSIIEDPELTNADKTAAIVQLVGYMADSPEMEQRIGSIIENPEFSDADKKAAMIQFVEYKLVAESGVEGEEIAALPDQLLNYSLSRLEYLTMEETQMYMNIIISINENPQVQGNIKNPIISN